MSTQSGYASAPPRRGVAFYFPFLRGICHHPPERVRGRLLAVVITGARQREGNNDGDTFYNYYALTW